ncbi:rubredoxin-like domain-containing protein [Ancylomarina sp. YFZ004]
MKELVRCRPCGYVMEKDKLGDVCPACGLPHKVFEPYREKVSLNRLFVLNLDLHPIAIHLSQTFMALIPLLLLKQIVFPNFYHEESAIVIHFCIALLPLTMLLAFITGIIDGITRFKSLKPPLLRNKLIFGVLIIGVSVALFFMKNIEGQKAIFLLISLAGLALAVILGLIGKRLLTVILPGKYIFRKAKPKIK